jgi:predicted flavoprotein YhiN
LAGHYDVAHAFDVAVVGAGAAGLMAAIFAGRAGAKVIALDGAKRIGAKILISGGGRCNVTHDVVTADDFNGNRNAIARILRTFDVPATVTFFEELGVRLKREETGKLFPVSNRARDVLDALLGAARAAGVEVRGGERITSVTRAVIPSAPPVIPSESEGPGGVGGAQPAAEGVVPPVPQVRRYARDDTVAGNFVINDAVQARRIILATGGRSVPKTGSDGSGYDLVRALGHSVTDVFPALVPLVVEPGHWTTSLSGTSVDAELLVKSPTGRVLRRERGSLLFTHFGLSGPVVLDISRHWIAAQPAALHANFLPGETFESLDAALIANIPSAYLRRRLPDRLVAALATPGARLSKEERRALVRNVVDLPLPVIRDRGFDYAEVTAGGVPLSEIDIRTMESRHCSGLYLCGEILDVDGKIGGYNFQWAWATGRLAGMAARNS